MLDLDQIRLQYEILNVPVEQLAQESGLLLEALRDHIKEFEWKRWWPEADLIIDENAEADDDSMTTQTELFLERSKRRMAVYNVAKEILLSQKYFKLESKLIDTASTIIDNATIEAKDVRSLASLYKDLTAKSITGALASFSIGEDSNGLPTVIVRDLSSS